jgi:hypothetical protein
MNFRKRCVHIINFMLSYPPNGPAALPARVFLRSLYCAVDQHDKSCPLCLLCFCHHYRAADEWVYQQEMACLLNLLALS